MKKLLVLSAIATATIATPALADGDNTGPDTTTITVNAVNPAKCNVTASGNSVSLANNQISDSDGFAVNDLGARISTALNGLTINAWCTGGANTVNLQRTALVRATTNGAQTTEGFNQAVIYDINMDIADAIRADGTKPIEGSSDGNVGPTDVGRFGPTGAGSLVVFSQESASNATSIGTAGGSGARSGFTSSPARLAAGTYSGSVTIVVTPNG